MEEKVESFKATSKVVMLPLDGLERVLTAAAAALLQSLMVLSTGKVVLATDRPATQSAHKDPSATFPIATSADYVNVNAARTIRTLTNTSGASWCGRIACLINGIIP